MMSRTSPFDRAAWNERAQGIILEQHFLTHLWLACCFALWVANLHHRIGKLRAWGLTV